MKILIGGGSGFIGQNAATAFLDAGHEVVILDVKPPTRASLLKCWVGSCDLADSGVAPQRWKEEADADAVFMLAGQTAVTESLERPAHDFRANVQSTVLMLESLRLAGSKALVVFTSTNKIYGSLNNTPELEPLDARWIPTRPMSARGINEWNHPDPETPYGVSKYCSELYYIEYMRTYGLKTIILRLSCVYGADQQGSEGQGWIAHIVRSTVRGDVINIYGDGRQVRDCLCVDDLLNLFMVLASRSRRVNPGSIYNVGGGPANTLSILELLAWLVARGYAPKVTFNDPRQADQRWYVSDMTAVYNELRWQPSVRLELGLTRLLEDARDELATQVIPV